MRMTGMPMRRLLPLSVLLLAGLAGAGCSRSPAGRSSAAGPATTSGTPNQAQQVQSNQSIPPKVRTMLKGVVPPAPTH